MDSRSNALRIHVREQGSGQFVAELERRVGMPYTPEQVPVAFDANFNAGDIDGVVSLFSDNATMRMPDGGGVVTGIEELRRQFSGLLANDVRICNKVRLSLVSDDVALVLLDWTLTMRLPDGRHVDQGGTATQVMGRGGDGVWKLRISNPLGTR
ncbi:YybH family protein [Paraburkholderia phenazinium]|jgi:ketosteroid isomerase-like protein|uniref:Ketosteroid isomerase homolog n=1 Tax=Paraburkholderia phenazinium TaxID=60549 RepID=A0A1G7TRB4_9BURK|nr:nuclear transport factor 2 family protein [Paraburkholderia phenazinium]SDG37504.1 Ketosteroid isomerase homolog [Paraburkholderia phenazinium]